MFKNKVIKNLKKRQELIGQPNNLTFTNGIISAGTTNVECFIMYEFDIVISQGGAVATNKYNDFSNNNLK